MSTNIYESPPLYDLVFSTVRDFEEEVLFLSEIYGDLSLAPEAAADDYDGLKMKVLEIGSGPGRHIKTGEDLGILKEGSVGIDLSSEMVEYARKVAQRQESYEVGDMHTYSGGSG